MLEMFKNEQFWGRRGIRRQITPPKGMFSHSDLSDGHKPIALRVMLLLSLQLSLSVDFWIGQSTSR